MLCGAFLIFKACFVSLSQFSICVNICFWWLFLNSGDRNTGTASLSARCSSCKSKGTFIRPASSSSNVFPIIMREHWNMLTPSPGTGSLLPCQLNVPFVSCKEHRKISLLLLIVEQRTTLPFHQNDPLVIIKEQRTAFLSGTWFPLY